MKNQTIASFLALSLSIVSNVAAQPTKNPAENTKAIPSVPAHQQEGKKVDPAQPDKKAQPATSEDPYVLGFKMKLIDGKEQDLSAYKGKVIVIVNVASKCGFTPQYEHLEKLYNEKKDQGLVILGFPANNFGGQEPGSNEEVAKFCKDKFGVTFPLFEKISVKGADQAPLYKKLTSQPAPVGGDPHWNFTKFVVDRSGNVVARYDAKRQDGMKLEPDLLAKVDELLKTK
jgi:glutathione peroxidase